MLVQHRVNSDRRGGSVNAPTRLSAPVSTCALPTVMASSARGNRDRLSLRSVVSRKLMEIVAVAGLRLYPRMCGEITVQSTARRRNRHPSCWRRGRIRAGFEETRCQGNLTKTGLRLFTHVKRS